MQEHNANRKVIRAAEIDDYGPDPLIVNIDQAALQNHNFRTSLWTGNHLQVTLMSIPPRGEIGLEVHHGVDQFLRVEGGYGLVQMGRRQDALIFESEVSDGHAIIVPAGAWHNIINIGGAPLKLYSTYTPPQHPRGAVHRTKAEADAAEAAEGQR